MNAHLASVSAYIPPTETRDYVRPEGGSGLGTFASNQFEAQKQDAQKRTIVWDAEKIGRLL